MTVFHVKESAKERSDGKLIAEGRVDARSSDSNSTAVTYPDER